MKIFVDIDETICETPESRDYSLATPIIDNINKINDLYDEGHEIVYWTARGSLTGQDWMELTVKQFKEWGVKYHDLKMGKPFYDIFIDDRAINSNQYFQNNKNDKDVKWDWT